MPARVLVAVLPFFLLACGGVRVKVKAPAIPRVTVKVPAVRVALPRVTARIVVPARATSAPAHGAFFGIPLSGESFALVIDTSGSMSERDRGRSSGAKIDVAKAELRGLLGQLPPTVRFNVWAFNDQFASLYGGLTPAAPEQVAHAQQWVAGMRAHGKTIIVNPLAAALQSGATTVVLLSDGLPNDKHEPARIIEMVRQAHARTGVTVHVVGLGMDQSDKLLNTLATSTGGAYAVY